MIEERNAKEKSADGAEPRVSPFASEWRRWVEEIRRSGKDGPVSVVLEVPAVVRG